MKRFHCGEDRLFLLLRNAPRNAMTTHVLILCTHKSARSLLAAGVLNPA